MNQSRHELAATVLLALATLATAWSAYQSRTWTGEQSEGYSHATAARIAVNRESALANRQVQIDVATFVQWINAHEEPRPALAAFYRSRFRDEFKPAFAAWLAAKPFTNPATPKTPFAMPQYRLESSTRADSLSQRLPPSPSKPRMRTSVQTTTCSRLCSLRPRSSSPGSVSSCRPRA